MAEVNCSGRYAWADTAVGLLIKYHLTFKRRNFLLNFSTPVFKM